MWRESYQAISKTYQYKAISLSFGIYRLKTVPKLILKNSPQRERIVEASA